MMLLLDTNVISEMMLSRLAPQVRKFLERHGREEIWTCSIVVGELLYGVALMPDGRRKKTLANDIELMIREDFHGRIYSYDLAAARFFGEILAARFRMGRPLSEADAQIAAIARTRGAHVVTRNVRDFEHCGIPLINPWD